MPNTVSSAVKPFADRPSGAPLPLLPAMPAQRRPLKMTEERLFELSLPQLLAELGVEYVTSSITDPKFYGTVIVPKSGPMVLAMPAGRDEFEHDCVVRSLLATALGLDVEPLPPAAFQTATFGPDDFAGKRA
ncbi:hypothetical protein ABZX93_14815 [Streptomyces sp. NPDC006632]|uniref:hypothetical protein n=1 Tax=Streptomyces sp. NPDC006632 TaxID=3157182 RepID=UPI0033A2378C